MTRDVSVFARNRLILLSCLLSLSAPASRAQQDPIDQGDGDSIFVVVSQPQLGIGDTALMVELYLSHDAQPIVGMAIGLKWDNPNLRLDSAAAAAGAGELLSLYEFFFYKNDVDSSNARRLFQCAGLSQPGDSLPASSQPQLAARFYFTLMAWSAGDSVCVDTASFSVISLVDRDAGEYTVTWGGGVCVESGEDGDGDGIGDAWDNCPDSSNADQANYDHDGLGDVCDADDDSDGVDDLADNCPLVSNPGQEDADGDGVGDACDVDCCSGRVGDVNQSGLDEPSIGDVSTLIDMLFLTQTPASCLAEADIDQSGGAAPSVADITVGDISMLIDYLFITGPSLGLPSCP